MLQYTEKLTYALRKLYTSYGYKKVSVKKFEEYDLYVDNRNFFKEENVITFMGAQGKLLALKPDVTLSIVKNISDSEGHFEKMYYLDRVYRFSKTNQEYKEINQVGLELVGTVDPYSYLEIIMLAIESLRCTEKPYLLDIAHLGFLTGLLEALDIDYYSKQTITACIHAKNTHDLKRLLRNLPLSVDVQEKVAQLPLLHGSFDKTLEKAKALVLNRQMSDALEELESIYLLLKSCNYEQKITLDFSMVNDIDYYNGIIFQGYIKNLSDLVLTGGQYDNLMKKLGKKQGALGFALNVDALAEFAEETAYDFDVLVLYDESTNCKELFDQVQKFIQKGLRVRTDTQSNGHLRYREIYRLTEDGLEAVQ